MSKSRNPGYVEGDHWETCDRCGQAFRSHQMKTQWDGLRVCEKDYDKRHPQDAVRETGSGCGTGPGGAGLDWNWGGGGYKPDLDPTTFIQEPNDAYFTDPPDGTFGDYLGDEEIFNPEDLGNIFIWIDADRTSEIFSDTGGTTTITGGATVANIDQTNWGVNDTFVETTAAQRHLYTTVNGKNALLTQVDGSTTSRIGKSWGGGKIPINNHTFFAVMSNMSFDSVNTSGGFKPFISIGSAYRGYNRYTQGDKSLWWASNATLFKTDSTINFPDTNQGVLVSATSDGDLVNVWYNVHENSSATNAYPDNGTIVYENNFWLGRGDAGASFITYYHEVIMFDKVLTDSERQQVEDYLINKWSLPIVT
jgi:hypothetical protein